jgi:hypothetical protein
MGDGTFIVGKDIAEGSCQLKIPAGANGAHGRQDVVSGSVWAVRMVSSASWPPVNRKWTG